MTKEEYLKAYKEDSLAEICSQLSDENDELRNQMTELSMRFRELSNKYEDLDIWNNVEKVFMKLKSLPAEDFIELYSRIKNLIEYPYFTKTETTCLNRYNNDAITSLHA